MFHNVADLCKEREITIADLAEKSGLEESRVLAIVMGRWTPSPKERQAVAAVFDLDVSELRWGHKTPIQHIYGHGPA